MNKFILAFMFICCLSSSGAAIMMSSSDAIMMSSSSGAIMMGGSKDSKESIQVSKSTNELPQESNSKVDVGNTYGNNTLPMSFAVYSDSACTTGKMIQGTKLDANQVPLDPRNVSINTGRPGSPACCIKGTNVYIEKGELNYPSGQVRTFHDMNTGKEELIIQLNDGECTDKYEFKFRPSL